MIINTIKKKNTKIQKIPQCRNRSNRQIVERGKIDIPSTHIHDVTHKCMT